MQKTLLVSHDDAILAKEPHGEHLQTLSKRMENYTSFPEFDEHNTDASKDSREPQTEQSSGSNSDIANQDSTGNSSSRWENCAKWFVESLEKQGIVCECLKDL